MDGELTEGEMWGPARSEKQSLMLLISNYIPRQMKMKVRVVQVVHQPYQGLWETLMDSDELLIDADLTFI